MNEKYYEGRVIAAHGTATDIVTMLEEMRPDWPADRQVALIGDARRYANSLLENLDAIQRVLTRVDDEADTIG